MELGCEGVRRDLPVLSTEVSDLARCGLYGVTGWILAADEGIEMGQGVSAVTGAINRVYMEVIGKGSALRGQIGEGNLEIDTNTISSTSSLDRPLDVARKRPQSEERRVGEHSDGLFPNGVVRHGDCVSLFPSYVVLCENTDAHGRGNEDV